MIYRTKLILGKVHDQIMIYQTKPGPRKFQGSEYPKP